MTKTKKKQEIIYLPFEKAEKEIEMEKILDFDEFDDVIAFMEILKNSYPLTPFYLILPIITDPTAYMDVDLYLSHSVGSTGGARFYLKMFAPDPGKVKDFHFLWNTSSNHYVYLCRNKVEFSLYIGTDRSENFYREILRCAGIPLEREYIGDSKEGKVYRETFRGYSALLEITKDGFIREYQDTPGCLKNILG